MTFVLDACTALSWSFEDERNEYAERVKVSLVDSTAWVPRIWISEVANGLVTATRRQRIDANKTTTILNTLARQTGLPLASLDERLDSARQNAGVQRYEPPVCTTGVT